MIDLELPPSNEVNVEALSEIFKSTTNSYKYLFFLSILDILKREQFRGVSPLSFEDIFVEMLVNAWYPHHYFTLSLGIRDTIGRKLDALKLGRIERIANFTTSDKSQLRQAIRENDLEPIITDLKKNVPFRLIRPFLIEKLRQFDVNYQVVQETPRIADLYFETYKPLYKFNGITFQECDAILFHPAWLNYLRVNYTIIRGWADWEWLDYMQRQNPTVHNLAGKLFVPES
ncbi:hypothetical protein [Spirulina subsalsa]|uniref:hypothetical protein n=1 Tax=Spirulina subsalsa TaxID=54311 RepID=UPI0002DE0D8F|nr:hypothetical protein [Spirulina subsalsa]